MNESQSTHRRAELFIAAAFLAVLGGGWLGSWALTGEQISWFRPSDDAYYYYQVAENVAAGHGFTLDRLNPTNGFHPLWLAVLVPVFALVPEPMSWGIGAVQILLLCLIAGSAVLVYRLAGSRFSRTTALLCALAFAFPEYRNLGFTGVEAGLALVVLLWIVRELVERPELLETRPRAADARLGVLLALGMLARLDVVFLLFAVAGLLTWRGLRNPSGGTLVRRLVRLAGKGLAVYWPVLLLVVPYLAWNQLAFGHPVPISGTLKSSFPEPSFRLDYLLRHWEYAGLLGAGVAGLLVAMVRRAPGDRLRVPVGLFAVAGLAHLGYTLVFASGGVFPWHYVSYLPAGLLGLGYLVEPVVRRLSAGGERLAVAAGVTVMLAGVAASFLHQLPDGRLAIESGTRLATKEAAAWARETLPAEAILGMKDSGAFTFYSRRRVVNLDGVMNSAAYQARKCSGELQSYLREQGVEYLVQHRVRLDAIGPGYGTYEQVIPCLLQEGRDATLLLREDDEVFRGSPYWSGVHGAAVIWGLPWAVGRDGTARLGPRSGPGRTSHPQPSPASSRTRTDDRS